MREGQEGHFQSKIKSEVKIPTLPLQNLQGKGGVPSGFLVRAVKSYAGFVTTEKLHAMRP
jgi:hypothetical protein